MTPIPKNAQAHTLRVLRLELHRIPIPALTTYLPTYLPGEVSGSNDLFIPRCIISLLDFFFFQ